MLATIWHKRTLLLGGHCASALRQLGCEVEIFDFDRKGLVDTVCLRPVSRLLEKMRGRPIHESFMQTYRNPIWINMKLLEAAERYRPDILLVLAGKDFFADTIRTISKDLGVKTARWWLDDPRGFNRSMQTAAAYDAYFTIDPSTVQQYRDKGLRHVLYLPFACNHNLYRPVQLTSKEKARYGGDICFVGNWLKERQPLLEALLGHDLRIWGPGWRKRLGGVSSWGRCIQGDGVYGQNVVKVYNAARINLNIHAWMGQEQAGLNLRVFEIPACGGFLLTDYVRELDNYLVTGQEVAVFRNVTQLREAVEYYLNHEDQRLNLAQRAYQRACRGPSYVERMKQCLAYLTGI